MWEGGKMGCLIYFMFYFHGEWRAWIVILYPCHAWDGRSLFSFTVRNLFCRLIARDLLMFYSKWNALVSELGFTLFQLLWSFCYSQLEEAGTKLFRLKEAIPGAKSLDYDSKMTFGESGLANSMISVAWDWNQTSRPYSCSQDLWLEVSYMFGPI